MPCLRCANGALDQLCEHCARPRKIRRIHAIFHDSRDIHTNWEASQEEEADPGEMNVEQEDEVTGAMIVDDGDDVEKALPFTLSGEFLCSGRSTPRLLSEEADAQELSQTPRARIERCPFASSPSSSQGPSALEQDASPADPDVPLRVLYWNLERFGGEAQWGLKETRADEAMNAIAAVIDFADPHFVVLVEVMAHMGRQQVQTLVDCLNAMHKRWSFVMPDIVTGQDPSKPNSGESYAVLYETGIGIEATFARIVKPSPVRTYMSGANAVEFRAPGEFLFQMGGQFALQDGAAWPLGIVALHAPGPEASRERQEQIEGVIHDLRLLELVAQPGTYPDVLVCADFNAHPDAYNISKEPDDHVDIALYRYATLSSASSDDESDGDEYEDDEGEDEADAGERALHDIEAGVAQLVPAPGKKFPGKRMINKVAMQVVSSHAQALVQQEQGYLMQLIEDNDLGHEFSHRRTREMKEWREEIEPLLDELADIEAGNADKVEQGLQAFADRTLNRKRNEEEADAVQENAFAEYESAREDVLTQLQAIEPRIAAIQYVEDMVDVMEVLRRPGTLKRERMARFKRELKQQIKTVEEEDKMRHRELAFSSLDPSGTIGDEADYTVGEWEGFFADLSLDTDLKTTRRRAITTLRSKGKTGKLHMPDGPESLLFSKYDQILARTLGHLRAPDNVTLPLLVAVLSADANKRLYDSVETDPDLPEALAQEDFLISERDEESPLASTPLHQFSGLVNGVLKNTPTWVSARSKSQGNIAKHTNKGNLSDAEVLLFSVSGSAAATAALEEADPPNFHALQLALYLSRSLSDHDPMLAGFWIDRSPGNRSEHDSGSSAQAAQQASQPAAHVQEDFFLQLLQEAQNRHDALCVIEGGTHPLANLLYSHFKAILLRLARWPLSVANAASFAAARLAPVYDAATDYLSGALAAATFQSMPGAICNIGNTCYLNSTMQVLSASPFYQRQIADAPASALKRIVELVVRLINHGTLVSEDFAELLRSALIGVGWHYGYREQDPADLLLLIANRLEFKRPWVMWQLLRSGLWHPTPDHFFVLEMAASPPLPVTLASCYQAFCLSLVDAIQVRRKAELDRASEGPVHMRRFSQNPLGAWEADRRPLANMASFMLYNGATPLCSIILHLGNERLDRGHYKAFVCRNGKWYECSDRIVTLATGTPALTDAMANGYLYFYRT